MRKVLVFTVLMVLLSGAAWGQTIYQADEFTLIERPDSYSVEFIEPKSGKIYSVFFERKPSGDMISVWSSPLKGHMEDPTAWKKFGSVEELCEDKCSVKHDGGWITIYGECEQRCLREYAQKEPWSDSHYRLEKNELTGDYRITWRDDTTGKWQSAYGAVCRDCTEKNWIELLDIFRKREQVNRSWKPIR